MKGEVITGAILVFALTTLFLVGPALTGNTISGNAAAETETEEGFFATLWEDIEEFLGFDEPSTKEDIETNRNEHDQGEEDTTIDETSFDPKQFISSVDELVAKGELEPQFESAYIATVLSPEEYEIYLAYIHSRGTGISENTLLGSTGDSGGTSGGGSPEGACPTTYSQYGITWTLKTAPTECGQYITGDHWVKGPIVITGISPKSSATGRAQHGSMINPGPDDPSVLKRTQGFDSAMKYNSYNAAKNVAAGVSAAKPLNVPVESSLVSTITYSNTQNRPQVKTAAILTVVKTAPKQGDFRPPYTGHDKTSKHNVATLDANLAAGVLANVAHDPAWDQWKPSTTKITSITQRMTMPCIDFIGLWVAEYARPADACQSYGRDQSSLVIAPALLALNMNYPNSIKRPLAIAVVQSAIDVYGVLENGGGYPATGYDAFYAGGGHRQSRLPTVLAAGKLMNDPAMLGVGQNKKYTWHEHQETFYVDQKTVDRSNAQLCWQRNCPVGINNSFCWKPECRDRNKGIMEKYTSTDIGTPEWVIGAYFESAHSGAGQVNKHWNAIYRQCCTASSYLGSILAIYLMDLRTEWGDESSLDYLDRYLKRTSKFFVVNGTLKKNPYRSVYNRHAEEVWDSIRNGLTKRYTGQQVGGTCSEGSPGAGNRCYKDDSSCQNGTKRPCGSNLGECKAGTQTCTNNKWGTCTGSVGPTTEICDGKDNDCNGNIDDNLQLKTCNEQRGVCAGAKEQCINGKLQGCDDNGYKAHNAKYENPEASCDLLDNNCDGAIDKNGGITVCTQNCTQIGGVICSATQSCSGTLTGSTNGPCCVGGVCKDPLKSLVHHWNLDETSGTTFKDTVGGDDLTCVGTCPVSVTAKNGKGLDFDGTDDMLRRNNNKMGALNKMTLTAWVKLEGTPVTAGARTFMNSRTNTGGDHAGFNIRGANEGFSFYVNGSGEIKSPDTPTVGQWYHLAGTYDGTTVRIYIDGTIKNSKAHTTARVGDTAKFISIGGHAESSGRHFNGIIDDVRIYSEALSASDIKAVMNDIGSGGGSPPNAPNNLRANSKDNPSIDLTWNDNSNNEEGFTIQRDLTTTFTNPVSANLNPNTVEFTDTFGLQASTTYHYRIRAYNNGGASTWSNTASATTGSSGAVCGNGKIETGETCDDNNTANGDGCSSTCQIETGWTCNGEPSSCTRIPQPNRPPTLFPIGDKTVIENKELQFIVRAADPDNDSLTFSTKNLPNGATFNPATQQFKWTPTTTQIGVYQNIQFSVDDGRGGTASENVTMKVLDNNDDDGDGVVNGLDRCKGTPPWLHAVVNKWGCPKTNISRGKYNDPRTTNISAIQNLSAAIGVRIGILEAGLIDFGLTKIRMLRYNTTGTYHYPIDINKHVHLQKNEISIHSDLVELNKPAELTFYNTTKTDPIVKRDGKVDTTITYIEYNETTKNLVIEVKGFSNYTVEQGSCGDNICSITETKTSCKQDCDSGGGSGPGGSGGGRNDKGTTKTITINLDDNKKHSTTILENMKLKIINDEKEYWTNIEKITSETVIITFINTTKTLEVKEFNLYSVDLDGDTTEDIELFTIKKGNNYEMTLQKVRETTQDGSSTNPQNDGSDKGSILQGELPTITGKKGIDLFIWILIGAAILAAILYFIVKKIVRRKNTGIPAFKA